MRIPRVTFDHALLFLAALVLVCAFAFTPKKKVVFKKSSIVFLQWWDAEMTSGALSKLIAAFEAENPAIQVTLDTRGKDELARLLRSGGADAPACDVIALDPYWASGLAKAGFLRPLPAALFEPPQLSEDEEPADEEADAPPADIYALPLVSFVNLLFYNTGLLQAAGLDRPPKSREDFFEACKKISSGNLGVYAYALSEDVWTDCLPWFWQAGAAPPEYAVKNGGFTAEAFLAGRPARETADFLNRLYHEKALLPFPFNVSEAEKIKAFSSGRAAMISAPVSAIRRLRELNTELDFSVTAIPPPGNYSAKPVFNVQGWFAGIPAASRNADSALIFLEFLNAHRAECASAAGALAPYTGTLETTGALEAHQPEQDELYAKAKNLADNAEIIEDYALFGDIEQIDAAVRAVVRAANGTERQGR